jgi:hypothetical protein
MAMGLGTHNSGLKLKARLHAQRPSKGHQSAAPAVAIANSGIKEHPLRRQILHANLL